MPNWCSNKIRVAGPTDAINDFVEWLDGGKGLLNKIISTPEELTKSQSPFNGSKQQSDDLVAEYGFDNWYDWNINKWGTKWDVDADVQQAGNEVSLIFDSAWSPPQRAIALLAQKFNNLSFHHAYIEEGNCFVGFDDYENGKLVDEMSNDDPDSEEWAEIAHDEFGWEPWPEDEDEVETPAKQ